MDHDMSMYRSIIDWHELKSLILNSDLSQVDAALLIPQAVTPNNIDLVLNEVKHELFRGDLEALGEFVKVFDFRDDFSTWQTKGNWSFIDESGQLTAAFRQGMQLLKAVQQTTPHLLPATSDTTS